MPDPRLADLVRRQIPLLDDLFGVGGYEVVDTSAEACELQASWVDIALSYDWRDQWVGAMLKPLLVPPDIADTYPDYSWLKFCGIEAGELRKGALDQQQVSEALTLIRPIVELFRDEQRARDALWFVRGYSEAYTDWRSGSWDS